MKKKDMKLGKDTKNRVYIFLSFILTIYMFLIFRMYYLQVIKSEHYKKLAEDNSIKRKKIESPRGKIYDRNGKLIVTNIAGYKLIFMKEEGYKQYKKNKIEKLALELGENYSNIYLKSFGRKTKRIVIDSNEKKRNFGYEIKKINTEDEEKYKKIVEKNPYLLIIEKNIKKFIFLKKKYKAIYYVPNYMRNEYIKDYTKTISNILEISEEEVDKIIKKGKKLSIYSPDDIIISEDFEEKKAHLLMEKLYEYPYIDIVDYPKRKYIYQDIAAHIIGYVKAISQKEYEELKNKGYERNDEIGKDGIEKYYDMELQGEDGYNYVEVDVKNRGLKEIESKKAIPGNDLYLTLDFDLQMHMTEFMRGKKGAFIAMESKTGAIITAVSSPTYDLNLLASKMSYEDWDKIQKNADMPLTNRVSVGSYPPGSIFKSIVCFAILEAGISPDEKYFSNGSYKIGEWEWRDWKKGGHGIVDMYLALEESCNTYFYSMANRIGKDRIIETSFKFGLGRPVEIDVYEVGSGRIPTEKWKREKEGQGWYQGDTLNMSIGQGYVLVTPLQMVQAYNMIANNGIRYKAHYLKKIVEHDNSEKDTIIRIENKYETKEQYFNVVKEGLRRVVHGSKGTAKVLKMKKVIPAAKTGSAQNAHYEESHGWAAGFVPYENPEITFVCFMEGSGSGGGTAAPIVKEFLKKYYENE